ncbi:MAG: serine/threonine protein kinase, partial [Acidobacteria bacterium ACB2]|nr:serine/threonine protein kinase [Acidobacteria bacterium ACB2]
MSEGRVGRYTIVRLLGRGAMGAVYLARDPLFDRPVALKTVVLPEGADSDVGDSSRARFREEARLSGRLSHPNIVSVFDCGEEGRTLWLSMEYVPGGSLAGRMAPGGVPLSVAEKVGILADVAGALSHAHSRGVIHRDVKPANILLTPSGVPKVSDFGIGKLLSGGVDLTATGEMVGSPAYMSPEQMRGERADARSDLFSLGIVLYQVLAGRKPFPAENLTALVRQIQHEEPEDPRTLSREVPDAAVAILSKLLAKVPEHRYPSAAAAEADLRAFHASLTGGDGGLSATIAAAPFPEAALPQAPPP